MKLIVGLGNPGIGYAKNRHNIGFMCINHFAKQYTIAFDKKKGQARIGEGEVAGSRVILARPQTFMNASGKAVDSLMAKYKVDPADLIVIHDDLDLPLGRIRIRQGGSAAGHHGIESIISYIESPDFIRMRIGIGRPATEDDNKDAEVIKFVLSSFSAEDKKIVDDILSRVSEALLALITDGLEAAMNKYNRTNPL